MKKLLLIAASCVALAACSKTEPESKKIEGEPFKAGQVVTLSASVVSPETKVSSEISGTGEDTKIDFKWETGDKILVKVGEETAEFTLSSTPGSNVGQFTGTMPADGTSFDVQYPVETPTTDLTNQTYSATEAFEKDRMLFTDTGCTLTEGSGSFELEAANAVLNLNLYGKNLTISKIAVKIGTTTYNLNINPAVALGWDATEVKKFNLIVPAGSSKFTMTASVVYNPDKLRDYKDKDYQDTETNYSKGIPITKRIYTTSAANTFTAGKVTVMPDKELTTVIWAPVNRAVSSTNKYGLYYQFGRKKGHGYVYQTSRESNAPSESNYKIPKNYWSSTDPIAEPNNNYFYSTSDQEQGDKNLHDWYTNTKSKQLPKWPTKQGDTGFNAKMDDPCPDGWCLPVSSNFSDLIGGNTTPSIVTGNHDRYHGQYSVKGCYLNGTSSANEDSNPVVFIPAGGYITWQGYNNENYKRGESIDYWGSDASTLRYIRATSHKEDCNVAHNSRAYACTIRCVQDGHEK